jgi:peroxidase
VDLFVGGMAESDARGSLVGPTFQAVIARQFRALRSGDRFYWQNQPFDRATLRMIQGTTLGAIIRRNTHTTTVPPNVFIAAPSGHRKNSMPPGPAH